MRDIISKLFKRENTVAVILLISAVLGLVGVPQRIGITSEQIILAFLGLLTVDTLIERLGYLNGLAADVRELRNKIEPSLTLTGYFSSDHIRNRFLFGWTKPMTYGSVVWPSMS